MIPRIKSFTAIEPMIYAYDTPGVTYHDGWIKIGYTDKQTPEQRIKQQTHTADILTRLLWKGFAKYTDNSGEYFRDEHFHAFLEFEKGTERKDGEERKKEWFKIDKATSRDYFDEFASRGALSADCEQNDYTLREEQTEAVRITKEYFEAGGTEFLWNAKPRFGKTLAAYDLVRQMDCANVLVVTNRPSIANSWAEDFMKFIGWRGKLCFVSENDALKHKPGVLSREAYKQILRNNITEDKGMIAFESLQGLKRSVYFGGDSPRLEWMAAEYVDGYGKKQYGLTFDLLIVDEAQEGVETMRTDQAFRNIRRKHTLYLSGTPFKQLASEQFSSKQIFNWSYADEQEKKETWVGNGSNPYEPLPKLAMYTYRMSDMILDKLAQGPDLSDDDSHDFAFDLNEFFLVDETNGKFVHEKEVKRFLESLYTQEKYPFSTPELRDELSHTVWYLNRINSVNALIELLANDPVFKEYKVIPAVGNGKRDDDDSQAVKAYDRVKEAIHKYDKTITLTVGQLTVGVTVPEWSAILMLCNLKSPSSYMQAAFRVQNPCETTKNGQRYRKETAYVFDFDPARTLIIFDEFANNLSRDTVDGRGTSEDREKNIRRLLNFFPVIGEDDEGTMVALDAKAVLSIPRQLKSREVVRRGFMSNFLFQNIHNIFSAPSYIRKLIEGMPVAHEEKTKTPTSLADADKVPLNKDGEIQVPTEITIGIAQGIFGDKIYGEVSAAVQEQLDTLTSSTTEDEAKKQLDNVAATLKQHVKQEAVQPAAEVYGAKKGFQKRLERQIDQEIDREIERVYVDFEQCHRIAQAELERRREVAESPAEVASAESDYRATLEDAMKTMMAAVQKTVEETIREKPVEVVAKLESHKKEQEKKSIEDSVRDHLRGFARTIPSFIMAYGDDNLTLSNFDDYTDDDVFKEVTGISEEFFRLLRDGGQILNPDTGEMEEFAGHLFNEDVFNDSIKEFLKKKAELANYFEDSHTEDIFDYIPPQKTNQIFTPRWVVSMMVDMLEENNPGCFDDPSKTFADLYMKSGLYITEIVKRLYRSEGMKNAFPDDKERILHILGNQVYGMAPSKIIYLIARNFILGFDEDIKNSVSHHFVEADAAEASKNGTLSKLVEQHFGGG